MRRITKHRNTWCWGSSTIIIIGNGIGVVTVSFEDDSPTEATITGLSVYSKSRNKGYGNELLRLAEEEAKENGKLKINIFADENEFPFQWYQRKGYSKDGSRIYIGYGNVKHLSKELN